MTMKKAARKGGEVKPPVQPAGACAFGTGETCPIHVRAHEHGAPIAFGVLTFSTRQYPPCESEICKHPDAGMIGERTDKRDVCCVGCGSELKVVCSLRGEHCRQCGRAMADFFLRCPNKPWWDFTGKHFNEEWLREGRLFDDTSADAKKADEKAKV